MQVIGVWSWTDYAEGEPPPPMTTMHIQHRMYQKCWKNRFDVLVTILALAVSLGIL